MLVKKGWETTLFYKKLNTIEATAKPARHNLRKINVWRGEERDIEHRKTKKMKSEPLNL